MDSTLWSRTPLVPRPSRFDTGAFAAEDLDQGTIVIPKWHDSFYEGMEGWVTGLVALPLTAATH